MEDLTDKILKGSSWYIDDYVYYVRERKFVITMLRSPDEQGTPCKNIIFSGVMNFKDEIHDLDDDCLDDIIGAHIDENNLVQIHTTQRDFYFTTKNEPIVEMIKV